MDIIKGLKSLGPDTIFSCLATEKRKFSSKQFTTTCLRDVMGIFISQPEKSSYGQAKFVKPIIFPTEDTKENDQHISYRQCAQKPTAFDDIVNYKEVAFHICAGCIH